MAQFDFITCQHHGDQKAAYVCEHLVKTIEDGKKRGLHYAMDDEGHFNGYCDDCAQMLADAGGQWTEELEDKAGIKAVCQMCTVRIFEVNKKDADKGGEASDDGAEASAKGSNGAGDGAEGESET